MVAIVPLAVILFMFFLSNTLIVGTFSSQTIKDSLIYILPVTLSINLILIISSGLLNLGDIKKYFGNVSWKIWAILGLILLCAFFLRGYIAPIGHRIYYDEDIYLNIGQNILQENKAILCNYGVGDKCYEWIMNKQPHAFPFFLSVLFRFYGVHEWVGFYTSIIMGTFSSLLIFLISYMLFKDKKISLFSALLFSLIPVHIRWSATTAVEPTTVFFILLSVFAFLLYIKENRIRNLLFAFTTLAFAIQFRPEILLLVPVFFLFFVLKKHKSIESILLNKKFIILIAVFLILVFPHVLQLNTFKESSWGSEESKFSLEYGKENIKTNGPFYFNNEKFPTIFTILFLVGSVFSLKKDRKKGIFLVSWFLAFFLIYVFFYAGSYDYGVDIRFSLLTYPPLILLAAYGIYSIEDYIPNRKWIFIIIVSSIVLVNFLQFVPFISKVGEEGSNARFVHKFAINTTKKLGKDCYVFTHVPSMFLVNDVNALQSWNLKTNEEGSRGILNKTNCTLFYKGYWCRIEPYKSDICDYILENYRTEVYSNKTFKDDDFTFYRIKEKLDE